MGLETAPSGVELVRDGSQTIQMLPVQPITIDMPAPDGITFTPLGLLRWVRGGVVEWWCSLRLPRAIQRASPMP